MLPTTAAPATVRVFIPAGDWLSDSTTTRNLPTILSSLLPPLRQWPSSHCCQPNSSAFIYLVTRPRYNNTLVNGLYLTHLGSAVTLRKKSFTSLQNPSRVCLSYHIVTHARSHTFAFTLVAYTATGTTPRHSASKPFNQRPTSQASSNYLHSISTDTRQARLY